MPDQGLTVEGLLVAIAIIGTLPFHRGDLHVEYETFDDLLLVVPKVQLNRLHHILEEEERRSLQQGTCR